MPEVVSIIAAYMRNTHLKDLYHSIAIASFEISFMAFKVTHDGYNRVGSLPSEFRVRLVQSVSTLDRYVGIIITYKVHKVHAECIIIILK